MPFSGKGGSALFGTPGTSSFTAIPDVRQWQFNETSDNKAYTSSSTSGRVRRIAANGDVQNGSIDVYSGDSAPVVTAGTLYRLKLMSKTGKFYEVEVIIDAINHLVNIESGDIVGHQIQFSGDGTITATNPS